MTAPSLDEIRELLQRTPGVLAALLDGLGERWLSADEGPDSFTPTDVLGHLIFGEETDWMPRIRIILEHGEERAFTPFDRFGFRHAHAGVPTGELLRRF